MTIARALTRIRTMPYRPTPFDFVVSAAVLGYLVGWPIRWYVEYVTQGPTAADWFKHWPRYACQYAAGAALAYPLLKWRFKRMCRKALLLSDARWARYANAARFWRRFLGAAAIVGFPFLESVKAWLDLGGFGWAFVQTVLLGLALFLIDWDELGRWAVATVTKSSND